MLSPSPWLPLVNGFTGPGPGCRGQVLAVARRQLGSKSPLTQGPQGAECLGALTLPGLRIHPVRFWQGHEYPQAGDAQGMPVQPGCTCLAKAPAQGLQPPVPCVLPPAKASVHPPTPAGQGSPGQRHTRAAPVVAHTLPAALPASLPIGDSFSPSPSTMRVPGGQQG